MKRVTNEPTFNLIADVELWSYIKQGDKAAFEALYHRYYSPLFAYAIRLRFDSETIKDCIQDMFVRIYTKRSELPELSYVKSYLYRSLTNALLDAVKSIRNNTAPMEELMDLSTDDDGFVTLFNKDDEDFQKVQLLQKGIEQLSAKQQQALYLHFIQEFSWEELSLTFEMSTHSCMNLVGRAIAKLRKTLRLE